MYPSDSAIEIYGELLPQVDRMAERLHVDRQTAVNRALAEYFAVSLPEGATRDILTRMQDDLGASFRAHARHAEGQLHLKSSLHHEFRPEIRYLVELPGARDPGRVTVALRANDIEILHRFDRFARAWSDIERAYVAGLGAADIAYALESGRFMRPLRAWPDPQAFDDIATALTAYVTALDEALKYYLTRDDAGRSDIERLFLRVTQIGLL